MSPSIFDISVESDNMVGHDWSKWIRIACFQYNDIIRGSDMDLVFFPDAVIHLIKISRVIRNPGGNLMLVGVGGSGTRQMTFFG